MHTMLVQDVEAEGDQVNLIDPRRRVERTHPGGSMRVDRSINVNPYGLTALALCALALVYLLFGSFSFSSPHSSSSATTSAGQNTISLRELLSAGIEAAKRGGREVKKVREMADIGEESKGKTREGANNPVTDGDMLSHKAMYHSIKRTFPGLSVISEEHDTSTDDDADSLPKHDAEVDRLISSDELVNLEDVDVWIDPLDATQEYTEKLLHYVTTMVCVAVRGEPVIGVIHKPFEDQTAWGFAGNLNVVNDRVREDSKGASSANDDLSHSRIIVSRSHSGPVDEVAKSALGQGITVEPAGGAGYKSWEVIKGKQDAYVHVTLIKKWDICAGNAILNALGGKLTDLAGKTVDYSGRPEPEPKNEGGVLATMHHHQEFLEALKGAGTGRR